MLTSFHATELETMQPTFLKADVCLSTERANTKQAPLFCSCYFQLLPRKALIRTYRIHISVTLKPSLYEKLEN